MPHIDPVAAPVHAQVQRANILITNLTTVTCMVGALAVAGVYDATTTARAACLVPCFVAGAQFGKRLFERSPSAWFRRVALVLLLATGLASLGLW